MTVQELIRILLNENPDDVVIYNTVPIIDALKEHPERRTSCGVTMVTSGDGFVELSERVMDYHDVNRRV